MRLKGALSLLITEHYRRTQSCVMRWFHGTNDEYTWPIFFVLSRDVRSCERSGAISKLFLYRTKIILNNSSAEKYICHEKIESAKFAFLSIFIILKNIFYSQNNILRIIKYYLSVFHVQYSHKIPLRVLIYY